MQLSRTAIVTSLKKKAVSLEPLSTLAQFKKGLFSTWHSRWPNALKYWYFNVIKLDTGEVYSYILAQASQGLFVNSHLHKTEGDTFLSGLLNAKKKEFPKKLSKIKLTDNTLVADDFKFTLNEKSISVAFGKEKFTADEVLDTSYFGNYVGAYEIYNLDARRGSVYICAQNVIIRGPLFSWNWLCFYLADGTPIRAFRILKRINKKLEVGKHMLRLENVVVSDTEIEFKASLGDRFFILTLAIDYKGEIVYQPKLSPEWRYPQIAVSVKKIDTNLPDINPKQKGYGILELTEGWAW